jgi:carbamoyl-phosphate synthase large subunit
MKKNDLTEKNILSELKKPTSDRILKVAQALRFKKSVKEIHSACKIDPWFIEQIRSNS